MENKSKELEIAIKAALEAGIILEKYFETEILKEFKEDNTPVTLADNECEAVIKKIILDVFPTHSILGEETGMTENGSEYIWNIDPIDGTRNFMNGIPIFATSIALVRNNEVIVGVIHNPITQSLFYGEKGRGAYFNDKQIFVSKDDRAHAMISISPGKKTDPAKLLFRELYYNFKQGVVSSVRNFGCTAMELAYVARGGLEANVQLGLSTYDFAAGVLLIQEAGGMITKHDGAPWQFPEGEFIASNGLFHDVLVNELKKQKAKLNLS